MSRKKPFLNLSPELANGCQSTLLPLDEEGLDALRSSIETWREEFYETNEGEDFEIKIVWKTQKEFDALPEM